ncbi:MAG: hypothetical protein DYG89_33020 [Caldilinea sp. CFX5]|nr:hypothetical protein [Caldilinea sp. CFX5]
MLHTLDCLRLEQTIRGIRPRVPDRFKGDVALRKGVNLCHKLLDIQIDPWRTLTSGDGKAQGDGVGRRGGLDWHTARQQQDERQAAP